MHCWKCETPISTAPGFGFYCPNLRCDACKPWDGGDHDDDPPPPDAGAPELTLAKAS